MPKAKTIWDVLNVPRPNARIESAGPGTGPYQRDTPVSKRPVNDGDKLIPHNQPANNTGYGGSPDLAVAAPPAPRQHDHGEVLTTTRERYPQLAHLGPPRPTIPRFNSVYDTLRTDRAWMYSNDVAVTGAVTPSTGGTVVTAVNPPANFGMLANRLSQFPGAIQTHLFIRTFGFGASALTMTGSLLVTFVDAAGGQITPLAILTGNQYNADLNNVNTLLPTPITDAGVPTLGSLQVTMTNGGTPVVCTFFLTFAWAYLLPDPAMNGYAGDTIPPLVKHYEEFVPLAVPSK